MELSLIAANCLASIIISSQIAVEALGPSSEQAITLFSPVFVANSRVEILNTVVKLFDKFLLLIQGRLFLQKDNIYQ